MENPKRILQSHNSVNNISPGLVSRIREKLALQNESLNAVDKWRLDSPIESGRVVRITREMAPKPDEPLELNHVPRWKRRQKFLYDTETGTLTSCEDEQDDKESIDSGEWLVFDEKDFVVESANSILKPVVYSTAETSLENVQNSRSSLIKSNANNSKSASTIESNKAVGAGVNFPDASIAMLSKQDSSLGRRVSVLETKEKLYRKAFLTAMTVVAVVLGLYFLSRRSRSQHVS